MPTRMSVQGDKRTRDALRRTAENLTGKPMFNAMEKAAIIVASGAKRNAPVDTGRLRSSINHDVQLAGTLMGGKTVQGIVGSNVEYAPYMEEGTGTPAGRAPVRMPPPSALQGWARRHGMNAYVVAKAIFKRGGLEPRRFFAQSMDDNRERVERIIGGAVRNSIRRS